MITSGSTVERPAPPTPPDAASNTVEPPIDDVGRLLVLAVAGGIALDVGLRGGVTNGLVSLGLVVAAFLVATRPSVSVEGRWVALMAAVPAVMLTLRTSPWLAVADLLAVGGLLAAAVACSRGGRAFDATVRELVLRALGSVGRGLERGASLTRLVPRPSGDTAETVWRTGRAVALALPLLVALVVLLATADAVFASLITPDVAVGPALGHIALALVLAIALALVALAVGDEASPSSRSGSFEAREIAVVLGLAVVVLGLFVVSQLVATTGAGRRLVEEAGLTPAEYARSGFFQLCWASLVIVSYLGLARRLATAEALRSRLVRGLSATVPFLALGLVVVSLRRLALYDRAFGLTMPRLAAVVAIVWLGAVLVMIALRNLGVGAPREWLPGVAVAAGVSLLLVVNLMNPEAFIVRHNVDRAADGATVDTSYLAELSHDATPAIATAIDHVNDPVLRDRLQAALRCGDDATGAAALNVAAARASRVRAARCP